MEWKFFADAIDFIHIEIRIADQNSRVFIGEIENNCFSTLHMNDSHKFMFASVMSDRLANFYQIEKVIKIF